MGVEVHRPLARLATGPIVAQEPVRVREDDDRDSLLARIHETEHRVFPRAVRALIEGRLRVEGRVVHVEGTEDEEGAG